MPKIDISTWKEFNLVNDLKFLTSKAKRINMVDLLPGDKPYISAKKENRGGSRNNW